MTTRCWSKWNRWDRRAIRARIPVSACEPGFGGTCRSCTTLSRNARRTRPEGSYTTYLFNSGLDKILKKVGEEAAETVVAAKNDSSQRIVEETADLIYHLLVMLVEKGVTLGRDSGRTSEAAEDRKENAEYVMQPDLEEIQRLRAQGNVIPVYKSVIADFLTPVSAFLKLEKDRPHAFLLESVEGGETIARYSFLGCDPFLVCRYRDGQPRRLHAEPSHHDGAVQVRQAVPNLPPFTGGAVGYFGYDMVRTIEDIPDTGTRRPRRRRCRFDVLQDGSGFRSPAASDPHHFESSSWTNRRNPSKCNTQSAVEEIQQNRSAAAGAARSLRQSRQTTRNVAVRSNFEKKDYLEAVAKAKEYIAAGDIFQVVLSQRFEVDLPDVAV